VVFSFSRIYPEQLIDAVEGAILPRHVFGEVPFERWRSHDWSTARIGSGPFLLEHHAPGDEIRMGRNPLYPAGRPPWIERLVIRVVPDIGNLMTQLLAGHIDYMENIPPRDAGRLADAEGMTVLPFDHPKYDYVGWNGSRAPFDDPEVRRALTLAIDREALVEDLLFGYGRVSAGPVPSFRWGADRTLVPWPHDPEEAKEILASKGFVPSGEQGLLMRDGVPLEFTLTTNAGNSLREAMLVKIQEQFRTLGVSVHVQPMEMRAWVGKNVSGDYDAYLGGWVFSGRVELEPLFGSAFHPPAGSNVVFYRSPEVDRLLALLGEAGDWDERLPVMHRIQQTIHADQPYTFLYEVMRIAAAGPRVAGAEIENPADSLAVVERVWIRP
jgi:peptide/nickel transport system substrate-binding protein